MRNVCQVPFLVIFMLSSIVTLAQKNKPSVKEVDSLILAAKYPEALDVCEQLLKKDKKNEELMRSKAFIYMKTEKYSAAIAVYKHILAKSNTACANCYGNMAQAFLRSGNRDSALLCISKALELEPAKASFYCTRAEIKMNTPADSLYVLADLNKAISLAPQTKEAYLLRARYQFGRVKMEEAKKDAYNVLKLEENNHEMFFMNYLILTAGGDNAGAMRYAERLYKDDPANPRMIMLKYAINASMGDTSGKKIMVDSLSKRHETDAVLHIYKSQYFFNAGLTDDYCATLFSAWGKLRTSFDSVAYRILAGSPGLYCNPAYAEYYIRRIETLKNSPEEAEKALQLCLQGEKNIPASCQIPFLTAYFYLQTGKTQEAFGAIQRSIGKYNREEVYRTSQLYLLPPDQAAGAEAGFRFKQFFTLQQCLFKMSRASGLNPGVSLLMQKTIDSTLVLLRYAPDKKIIEDFIYMSTDFYYQQKNEQGIKLFRQALEKQNIKSGIPFLYRSILLYEQNLPGTYTKTEQAKNPTTADFPLLRITSRSKKPAGKWLNEIAGELNEGITTSPESNYLYYLRAAVKWNKGDAGACADFKKAMELKLDAGNFPEIPGLCK